MNWSLRIGFLITTFSLIVGAAHAIEVPKKYAVNNKFKTRIEDYVKDKLKDPDSAKFKAMKAGKYLDGKIVVCGEVNGKNSYGGYTGFQLFSVQLNQDGSLEFGGFGVDDFS